ncbi:MAG: 8-oxo-dGTP diphosphatase MutT [Aliivibrio sp.]|uniref:8-oxo-dGTP diphosphatase MutT n=1 Tax=Aliivibrio sp. TaxID=1872443 RepID=UPI001A45F625|nr:8-oxo-dGTP diphosphatase MutT [Aliivibrio sp.]
MDRQRVWVAAGVIYNSVQSAIFITKRASHLHQGGYWEFPGGKVELGETAEQALIRELDEEIGIISTSLEPFVQIEFDYPDKALKFDFIKVISFDGEPYGKEGQQGEWVTIKQLKNYSFPEANESVVKLVIKQAEK